MIKVICLSGGMDSTTLLYKEVRDSRKPADIYAIGFDYGQRHTRELEMASKTAYSLGIPYLIVDLPLTEVLSSSVLTGPGKVPEGMYDASNMSVTVVPNRNMIFLSIAVAYAENLRTLAKAKYAAVYMAPHGGDHEIYHDCRATFFNPIYVAIDVATAGGVTVHVPFLNSSKTDIFRLGCQLNVHWSLTYSCYKGGEVHCGKCGTCVERIEAVLQTSIGTDTVEYDYDGWLFAVELLKKNKRINPLSVHEYEEYFAHLTRSV